MPDLFPRPLIERLSGAVDAGPVPVPNASEASWARDTSGRLWVRKREIHTNWEPLLAEAASYLLGLELEVRQPHGAVFHDGAEWSWMSEAIPAIGEHWNPDMRDFIDNPDEVGRMLALDALVFNEDRHPGNILVQPLDDEVHLCLWAIDCGKAEIGWPRDFIGRGLAHPDPAHNHAPGLPVETLQSSAMDAAAVAVHVAEEKLRRIIVEACELAGEPGTDALAEALISRCRHAPEIVSRYLDALKALP